jgi:hypothetical protein
MARHAGLLTLPPDGGGSTKLSLLPREEWWRLFIESTQNGRPNPRLIGRGKPALKYAFEDDESPGYYGAMVKAFHDNLLTDAEVAKPLDFALYTDLHRQVLQCVLRARDNAYQPVPQKPGGCPAEGAKPTCSFDKKPSSFGAWFDLGKPDAEAVEVNELVHERLVVLAPDAHAEFDALTTLALLGPVPKTAPKQRDLASGYVVARREDIFHRIMTRYEHDVTQAPAGVGKVCAIAAAVRALHIAHLFSDGNGRLNTMMVLDKLLLQQHLVPSMFADTARFGGDSLNSLAEQIIAGMGSSGFLGFVAVGTDSIKDKMGYLKEQFAALHLQEGKVQCPPPAPLVWH